MKELGGLIIAILFTSVIIIGGSTFINDVAGKNPGVLPGYYEGLNLTTEIENELGDVNSLSENDSNIGVSGLITIITKLLFAVPKFAANFGYGVVEFLMLPVLLADILRIIIYSLYIITLGILVFRGVVT